MNKLSPILPAMLVVLSSARGADRAWNRPLLLETNRIVHALAFSPDNLYLAVGMEMGHVEVFPNGCPDGLPLSPLSRDTRASCCDRIECLAFSGDSKRLLVAGCPGGANVFEIPSVKQLKEISLLVNRNAGLSADGRQMWANNAIYDLTGDLKKEEEPKRIREFAGSEVLLMTPDGKQIVAGKGNVVSVWDAATGKPVRELSAHARDDVRELALSPNGKLLATHAPLRIWDLATGKVVASLDPKGYCHKMLFTPDGKRLVLVINTAAKSIKSGEKNYNYTVRVWDIAADKEVTTLCQSEYYWPMAMAPDGTLAYTKDGHRIEFYDTGSTYFPHRV